MDRRSCFKQCAAVVDGESIQVWAGIVRAPATAIAALTGFAALLLSAIAIDSSFAQEAEPARDTFAADGEPDWSLLNLDAMTLLENPSTRMLRGTQSHQDGSESSWSRKDNPNGSSAVTVKKSVSPFWDARVGADLSVAQDNQTAFTRTRPETFQPWDKTERSTGNAWATITAPGVGALWDKTAIEARIDPFDDRSKVGTSVSKSLPIDNDRYSVTLQNGINLHQHGVIPGIAVFGHSARTVEVDRSAKFSINETGTSFLAGQTLSTTDDRWLRKFGAEQKLFGGINVTGSVSQMPDGVLNKSIGAGFKRSW